MDSLKLNNHDYRASSESSIKIFKDRIEFVNPGSLPENITINDIVSGKTISTPRNKQIASIFKEAGEIERYGSGIKRVCQIISATTANSPVFETIGNSFKVTLFSIEQKYAGGINGGINNINTAIIDYIINNSGQKAKDIQQALNISLRKVERHIKELKDKQLIEFRGSKKTGGYYMVNKA